MQPYDPYDWFWVVAGDDARAWSSAAASYVSDYPLDRLTRIDTEQNLSDVLRPYGLKGPYISSLDVNSERDQRMALFTFGGKVYDLAGQSLANVSGAGTLALAAIVNGAQPGDLRWADPNEDFTWITHDNTIVPMDAQTCWAFAQTAASWRKHCIYKARTIKDMDPVPADFTSDKYWE